MVVKVVKRKKVIKVAWKIALISKSGQLGITLRLRHQGVPPLRGGGASFEAHHSSYSSAAIYKATIMLNTRLKRESYGISGCVEIFSWNGLQGQNNILFLMRLFHWTIQVSLKAERIQTSHFEITPNDWKKLSRGFFAAVLRLKEDWRSGQLSDFFVCSTAFL